MNGENVARCSERSCLEAATYKIAALWSDDRYSELKTYGFACPDHLKSMLRRAEVRWLAYEPVSEEVVQEVGVYRYEPGEGVDRPWVRDSEIEARIRS